MKRVILGVAVLGLVGTGAAHGSGKPEDAVHYRQGIMMGMAWNVGPMGAMVKGDMDFDAGKFAFLAGRLAVLAPMSEEAFTADTAAAKSEAKPELWDNLDDFKQRMEALRKEAAKLADVTKGGDEGAMKAAFGDTVKVCKGCHDEYQKEH
ncbi:MAG: cytochrome c [Gammaproteobacteria bacterium]